MDTRNVVLNRPAVEPGLDLLGGETFVSFDKKAVKLLTARGAAARLLQ